MHTCMDAYIRTYTVITSIHMHVQQVNKQTHINCMDGWMDGWMDGRMDGWTEGRTDGWMEGGMEEGRIENIPHTRVGPSTTMGYLP